MQKKSKKGFLILSIITVIYLIVYIGWRVFYTLPSHEEYGWVAFIGGILLVVAEGINVIEAIVHYVDLNRMMVPPMPKLPNEYFPDVDIFIATHNEEEDILYKTVNACCMLDYPDKSKVHVYLCDDTARENVKKLARKFNVGYFGMTDNKLAKAGNLNNALAKTDSPLIVTFDADMIPNSDFLLETVPYFFLPRMKQTEDGEWVFKEESEIDPRDKIGFIQTPQTFYNPDLFQYNLYNERSIPNEQDYFFRQVNVGKNRSNSPIYAGSNTVIAREALEEIGGIQTGTITEDFETGLLIESNGYKCYAIDKMLAKGLAPNTISSLIKQRERWARGCVYSLRRVHLLLNPRFNFKLKMSYMACRLYWGSFTRRLIYILSPILFVLLGIPVVICDLKQLLLIWLPSYALYSFVLKKISGNIRNTRWSNIIDTIMFPYLLVPIWLEVLGVRKKNFVVTTKSRNLGSGSDLYLALPHAVLLGLTFVSFLLCLRDIISYRAFGGIVVCYWLLVNTFSLIMAIFFMKGRRNTRESERFTVNLPIEIKYNGKEYFGTVNDISEGGFSFTMDDAVFLPYEEDSDSNMYIQDRHYYASIKGRIVSVKQEDGKWKYNTKISQLDEENKRQYLQIIYDRVHTLPKKLEASMGYFEDLTNNLNARMKSGEESLRKSARINISEYCDTNAGYQVLLQNYNFEYVRLKCEEHTLKENIILFPDKSYAMNCQQSKVNKNIYKIINWDELEKNNEFIQIIKKWCEKSTINA